MSAVALIPRSVLFGNPERVAPVISPDGTRLGFVAPVDGVLNVWVGPLSDPSAAQPVTRVPGHGVRSFLFGEDDRSLLYLRDVDGDEQWQVHTLDLATGTSTLRTPDHGVSAQVLQHSRWSPDIVVIGMNSRDPTLHDLYALRLSGGPPELIAENPGYVAWLVDTDLRVRGGVQMGPDGGATIMRRDQRTGTDRPWLEIPAADVAGTGVLSFPRDADGVFALTSIGADTVRLVHLHDDGTLEVDPESLRPRAAVVGQDRDAWIALDPAFADLLARVREQCSGELGLRCTERSGRHWLITEAPSDGPVRFHVWDAASGRLDFLFSHMPALEDYPLAPMETFSFRARDGLLVHGYLTFPRDLSRANLPAVVTVHGGPWDRDQWGLSVEAQWLANRGYVCVQVNYRGSTGYGKAFLAAGDKQWGRAMQDDLSDAIDHLVGLGFVDPGRVGIYGASYGGYAALAGVAFTPDRYRCAVDLVGPSNLLTLLGSVPEHHRPMLAVMHARIGDPLTEAGMLWERSPLSAADRITAPILVAQGARDPRVSRAESEQIVAALRDRGLPHDYLLFEDEGHGLARPENRELFYARVEAFLAEHLGGRCEP
jgi:dipeptidyl aminopeptidase/acylaminoacyl peptidase